MTVEALEKKLNEERIIALHCNEDFYGMYKAEREDRFGKRVEIHSKGETFTLYNDKDINATGDIYYRINDAKSMFYEGMVLISSIVRAIEDGILEVIGDYKKPKVTVYSVEELLPVKTVAMN